MAYNVFRIDLQSSEMVALCKSFETSLYNILEQMDSIAVLFFSVILCFTGYHFLFFFTQSTYMRDCQSLDFPEHYWNKGAVCEIILISCTNA